MNPVATLPPELQEALGQTDLLGSSSDQATIPLLQRQLIGPSTVVEQQSGAEGTSAAQIVLETANRLVRSMGCSISLHNMDLNFIRCLATIGIDTRAAMNIARPFAAWNKKRHFHVKATGFDIVRGKVSPPAAPNESGATRLPAGQLMYAVLRGDQESCWILSFIRTGTTEPFGDHEVALLRNILPMFEWLLSHEINSTAAEAGAPSWQILNELNLGVLLVGADGQVAAANGVAKSMLKSCQSLMLTNGRLGAKRAADNARFQKALRETGRMDQSAGRAIVIESDEGNGTLLIRFIRLGESVRLRGLRDPCMTIFISDTSLHNAPNPVPLQQMYGLTPLEADIVSLICAGMCPKEVATKLDITTNTVRSYLKSIFRKMGVHRQADLIRILAIGL